MVIGLITVPKFCTHEFIDDETIFLITKIINETLEVPIKVIEYYPDNILKRIKDHNFNCLMNFAYNFKESKVNLSQPEIVACLEQSNIPILGSPSSTQYLAQDKIKTGIAAEKIGIRVPKSLNLNETGDEVVVLVKPRFGSCHRDTFVKKVKEVKQLSFKESMLFQEFISGREFTVSVLEVANYGIMPLFPMESIFLKDKATKYTILNWEECPWKNEIDFNDTFNLRKLAYNLFVEFGFKDYARFDFKIDSNQTPVLLDANSLPNLHPTKSFLPLNSKLLGIGYADLITLLTYNLLSKVVEINQTNIKADLEKIYFKFSSLIMPYIK